MCGIAGICKFSGNAVEQIHRMNQEMLHRGPDAGGYWLDENNNVVLGHRRLSIIDLSEQGAQPMISSSGRYVICFNGEIYNHKDIWVELKKHQQTKTLRSTSDTEVILEAFELLGLDQTLTMMKGMFAIALFDRQEKTLYLMRDRVGEKPLYYGFVNGSFAFASDLACLKKIEGFKNEIQTDVLGLYFQYGYIPTPYSIYKDIYKLEPGKVLTLNVANLQYDISTYWSMSQVAVEGQNQLFTGSEKEAADELEKHLKTAIEGQMMADVPLGAFLSGGIDSALVVSLMQSLKQEKVKTFTIGFGVESYNEATFAKEIASHLGTEHTEMYINQNDGFEVIQNIGKAYTEPFADSSQIPTMLVSKMTRKHVTVSLSGDGGDELFCGYNSYAVAEQELRNLQKRIGFVPMSVQRKISGLSKKLASPSRERLHKMELFMGLETLEQEHSRKGLEDARIPFLSKNKIQIPCSNSEYPAGLLHDPIHNLMLMDLLQYHESDILTKVDRAGMFYSLETRIPLLDKDVVAFAWTLPLKYKYSENVTKRVLKNILYRYVPKEMMERPKKGFSIPLSSWMKEGSMRIWAENMMHDGNGACRDILNVKVIESLWKDFTEKGIWTEKLWYILMFQQWMLENNTFQKDNESF